MTKAESHYLKCEDPNCEKIYCVERRDYLHQIKAKNRKLNEIKNMAIKEMACHTSGAIKKCECPVCKLRRLPY